MKDEPTPATTDEADGVVWSADRQSTYNEACRQYYLACCGKDEVAQARWLTVARQMESEGGLL